MKNFHQRSNILTEESIANIQSALERSWSKDTADPENTNDWSENNKAFGQCAVTSLVIFDMFGGRIIYDKTNFHIWNELPDGSQHDFTRSQFNDERIFSIYKYKTCEDILYDERGKAMNISKRYEILRQRFLIWK